MLFGRRSFRSAAGSRTAGADLEEIQVRFAGGESGAVGWSVGGGGSAHERVAVGRRGRGPPDSLQPRGSLGGEDRDWMGQTFSQSEWLLGDEKGIAEQDGRKNVVANRIVTSRTVGTFMIVQDGEDWNAACHYCTGLCACTRRR